MFTEANMFPGVNCFGGSLIISGAEMSSTNDVFPVGKIVHPMNLYSFSLYTLRNDNDVLSHTFATISPCAHTGRQITRPNF